MLGTLESAWVVAAPLGRNLELVIVDVLRLILFVTKPIVGLLADLLEHGFAQIVEWLSSDDCLVFGFLSIKLLGRDDEVVRVRFLRDVLVTLHDISLLHVKSGAFLGVRLRAAPRPVDVQVSARPLGLRNPGCPKSELLLRISRGFLFGQRSVLLLFFVEYFPNLGLVDLLPEFRELFLLLGLGRAPVSLLVFGLLVEGAQFRNLREQALGQFFLLADGQRVIGRAFTHYGSPILVEGFE